MYRRILVLGVATILCLLPAAVQAQRGQQVFDLFLQGAQMELQRQQQLEWQQQQRQHLQRLHQQFVAQWQTCHGGNIDACDQALAYPYVNATDRQSLLNRRNHIVAAEQEAAERARREQIQAQLEEQRRQRERDEAERRRERDREDAERRRKLAEEAEREHAIQARAMALQQEQHWQTIYLLLGGLGVAIAAVLALAIAFVMRRPMAKAETEPSIEPSIDAETSDEVQPDPAAVEPMPSVPAAAHDTAGALAAMELALAYLDEVREAPTPDLDDKDTRRHHLNTLSLATKQLTLASKLDADAVLEGENDGVPYRYSLNELKAEALLLEGITHQRYDIRRAIPALTAATKLNPGSARAFYVLGLVHVSNMNKGQAVAAFERAVVLDPKNIAYRKELNRAQSLSAAEVAGYKMTRAGERIFDAGVKTANAGIMTWNVFAVLWNIATFPLRLLFGIFRMLRLHPFA